ncbi:MAG: sugar phosphate isomerase/epimerase, partial [Armatimonadota bacterium]|nr:sugar phosphate isomerase/epimerase [Armatimonadota bacterium]
IALQTYTVREEMARDFKGTLQKIAEMGYPAVQLSDTGGMSIEEARNFLESLGLTVFGGHFGLEQLEKNLDSVLQLARGLGMEYIVVPWLAEELRRDADGWKGVAQRMNAIGQKVVDAGFVFGYHNHSFEFQRFDGKYGLDILMENTDPQLVQLELDTYWVKHGGEDPAEYIRKYAGRVPLLHLKDMAQDGSFAEVGHGILDWDSIFQAAEEAGVKWAAVEQDTCQRPPLESARLSLEFLKSKGLL